MGSLEAAETTMAIEVTDEETIVAVVVTVMVTETTGRAAATSFKRAATANEMKGPSLRSQRLSMPSKLLRTPYGQSTYD